MNIRHYQAAVWQAPSPEHSIDVVNAVDKTRQDRDCTVRRGESGEIGRYSC